MVEAVRGLTRAGPRLQVLPQPHQVSFTVGKASIHSHTGDLHRLVYQLAAVGFHFFNVSFDIGHIDDYRRSLGFIGFVYRTVDGSWFFGKTIVITIGGRYHGILLIKIHHLPFENGLIEFFGSFLVLGGNLKVYDAVQGMIIFGVDPKLLRKAFREVIGVLADSESEKKMPQPDERKPQNAFHAKTARELHLDLRPAYVQNRDRPVDMSYIHSQSVTL